MPRQLQLYPLASAAELEASIQSKELGRDDCVPAEDKQEATAEGWGARTEGTLGQCRALFQLGVKRIGL